MAAPPANTSWASVPQDAELKEQRDKLAKIVQVQMMEFKVNTPDKLAKCVTRLMQMFNKILSNPDDQKYRKVKLKASMSSLKACLKTLFLTQQMWLSTDQGDERNFQEGSIGGCKTNRSLPAGSWLAHQGEHLLCFSCG